MGVLIMAEGAQAGALGLSPLGDRGPDFALPQDPAVLVVVVAALGEKRVGPPAPTPDNPGHRCDPVEQGQELGDVARGSRRSAGE